MHMAENIPDIEDSLSLRRLDKKLEFVSSHFDIRCICQLPSFPSPTPPYLFLGSPLHPTYHGLIIAPQSHLYLKYFFLP